MRDINLRMLPEEKPNIYVRDTLGFVSEVLCCTLAQTNGDESLPIDAVLSITVGHEALEFGYA